MRTISVMASLLLALSSVGATASDPTNILEISKLVLPMNRAALEAAAGRVQATGDSAVLTQLKPGARFFDSAGIEVGTIISADAKQVMIEADGTKATLPLSSFTAGAAGPRLALLRADFMSKLAAQTVEKIAIPEPTK